MRLFLLEVREMPYASNADLPEEVQKLPEHGMTIFRAAFNAAADEYKGDDAESRCFATAWAAVKRIYVKGENGQWTRKEGKSVDADDGGIKGDGGGDAEKAGRRLKGDMLSSAQEALATLAKIVKWASYEDQKPEASSQEPEEDAEDEGKGLKAANMADWIVAKIHQSFTVTADDMLADGRLTQKERIALSNGIGEALDALNKRLEQDDLKQLRSRHPYEVAEPDQPKQTVGPVVQNNAMGMESGRSINPETTPDTAGASAGTEATKATGGDSAPDRAVKALGSNRIGGYLMLWGTPQAKDLTGEYFTRETEEVLSIYRSMGKLPALYHHGRDENVKATVVGQIDVLDPDEVGLWAEAQLTTANKYRAAVLDLVRQNALAWSSGAIPGGRKVAGDGKILRWPIMEGSLTPTPAEPRMVIERPIAELKSYFAEIGLQAPDDLFTDTDRQREAALEHERLRLLEM
jgi:cation transport regulator